MMLLATNPTWQERARAEVGMVLNETLRLYPPAVFLVRTAMEDTKLGNLIVPEGTGVLVPILSILHDKEVWGEDANEFNPQRFADGVANASKHPFAFLPFSHRPRVCLGQGFALMEAKVALTMILHRFSLEISPIQMPHTGICIQERGCCHQVLDWHCIEELFSHLDPALLAMPANGDVPGETICIKAISNLIVRMGSLKT
ncbi:hypothetical protein SELMODRAFT_412962 [Selaginella moellendorffii]|uniref:Cytochrome P450-dependent monooxygenase n=1 Tax=Selaginella moellendorffii TaxID=88036 RepID=D8RMX1_SELML|nr:hypothetical protein SELMODRAFT_412962 [Selaginella moellendorffii]